VSDAQKRWFGRIWIEVENQTRTGSQ
jgi:hypothetical protein